MYNSNNNVQSTLRNHSNLFMIHSLLNKICLSSHQLPYIVYGYLYLYVKFYKSLWTSEQG